MVRVLTCTVFGHRYRFRAEGPVLVWECQRSCGAAGQKEYPSADRAQVMAAALDREDQADIGRRAPLLGMFPLRLLHRRRQAQRHR